MSWEKEAQPKGADLILSPQERPRKRGRVEIYSPIDRFKLACTAIRGSSLTAAGEIAALHSATDFEEVEKGNQREASRKVTITGLLELQHCYLFFLAEKMSFSSFLSLVIDTTTDSRREFMTIIFSGISDEGEWEEVGNLLEVKGHKAKDQVSLSLSFFSSNERREGSHQGKERKEED